MTAMHRLSLLAPTVGEVPHLGEDVPRTIPNLLQLVLQGRVLSPAQEAYTLRLLTAAVVELLDAGENTFRPSHTTPLFLRVAHRGSDHLAKPSGHDEAQHEENEGRDGTLSNPFRHDPSEKRALHNGEPSTGPAGANTQASLLTGAGPGDGTQQTPPIPNTDTVCS